MSGKALLLSGPIMKPEQAKAFRVLCDQLIREEDPIQFRFFRAVLDELLDDVLRGLPPNAASYDE